MAEIFYNSIIWRLRIFIVWKIILKQNLHVLYANIWIKEKPAVLFNQFHNNGQVKQFSTTPLVLSSILLFLRLIKIFTTFSASFLSQFILFACTSWYELDRLNIEMDFFYSLFLFSMIFLGLILRKLKRSSWNSILFCLFISYWNVLEYWF